MSANSATVDKKIALEDAARNSRTMAHAALSAGNAAAVKRYQALRKEKLAKAASNLSGKEKEEHEALLVTKLESFPDLKKFIDEKEKEDNNKNNLFKRYGLGLLERALFHAIEGRFVEFVKQLIALGANVTVQTPRLHFRDISITPLYYTLVLCYSPNKLEEDNSAIAVMADWSSAANKERAVIIYELITAGATIDDPALAGVFSTTFLHTLILRVVKYPEFLDTLNLVLACYPDLNIVNSCNETPLAVLILDLLNHIIVDIPKLSNSEEIQKSVNKTQLYKTIVAALIQSGRQDYTKVSSDHKKILSLFMPDTQREIRVILDEMVLKLRSETLNLSIYKNEEIMKEIFDIILDDMAAQCIEHYSSVKHREYRSAEYYLLDYARATYHHNNPIDPDANYLVSQDSNPLYPDSIYFIVLNGNKYIDYRAGYIKEKIVDRVLAMIIESYTLGFASVHCQGYLSPAVQATTSNIVATIPNPAAAAVAAPSTAQNPNARIPHTNVNYQQTDKSAEALWKIVIQYCCSEQLFTYISAARNFAPHYDLPTTNSTVEQFLRTVASFEVVDTAAAAVAGAAGAGAGILTAYNRVAGNPAVAPVMLGGAAAAAALQKPTPN